MKNISFMIMSDAHLDSDFAIDCNARRREQRHAFDEALKLCRRYTIDYLLVPGDLFDKRSPDPETVNYVISSFAALDRTAVIIAPGNHDPMTVDSPYRLYDWPQNVFIFPDKKVTFVEFNDKIRGVADRDYLFSAGRETGRRGIRFYGAAFEGHFSRESLFVSRDGRTPRLSPSFVNVLVMHGTVVTDNAKSNYNPIPKDVLDECGFDLCAIGSNHSYSRKGTVVSSGVLCPRNFDEPGDTGVVMGEITDDGRLLTDFVPINAIRYETVKYDVSGAEDLSVRAITNGIKAITNRADCHRIEITGEIGYDENIDTAGIRTELSGYYPIVTVTDKTIKKADMRLLTAEKTFRGVFASKVWGKVKKQRDDEKETGKAPAYSERAFESAINISLKIFDGAGLANEQKNASRANENSANRRTSEGFSYDLFDSGSYSKAADTVNAVMNGDVSTGAPQDETI